jgi:hypothetical protein
MKNLIKLSFIAFLFFTSCGEKDEAIYGASPEDQTLVFWRTGAQTFGVPINATGSVNVEVAVTNVSASDRTVTFELLPSPNTTALPANYSIPTFSVTIPANKYFGTFVINGVDDALLTTSPRIIALRLKSISDSKAVVSSTIKNISLLQVCPIPANKFVGNYLLTEITPFVDGPTLDHGSVINLVRVSETQRKFSTRNYINYCTTTYKDFEFSLSCNQVIVKAGQTSTCSCAAPGLFFEPGIVPGTYDVANDSEFFMTFTNDATSNCGTPVQTTYKFTKQ